MQLDIKRLQTTKFQILANCSLSRACCFDLWRSSSYFVYLVHICDSDTRVFLIFLFIFFRNVVILPKCTYHRGVQLLMVTVAIVSRLRHLRFWHKTWYKIRKHMTTSWISVIFSCVNFYFLFSFFIFSTASSLQTIQIIELNLPTCSRNLKRTQAWVWMWPRCHRSCLHLVLTSILTDPITSGQHSNLPKMHWDPITQTTFRGGLGCKRHEVF